METEIEEIGIALFGQSWMAQVANNLYDLNGKNISRQTVQKWHRNNSLPKWAKDKLITLASQRKNEIISIYNILDNHESVVVPAIERFIRSNGSQLNPQSIVYCQLQFDRDDRDNEQYYVNITLEPQQGEGWQKFSFSEKYYQRELLNLRNLLKDKLNPFFAIAK